MNRGTDIVEIRFGNVVLLALCLVLVIAVAPRAQAADTGKTFSTPEGAVTALAVAVSAKDKAALDALFGPSASDVENPDPVQSANEFASFAAALGETNRIAHQSDTKCVLEVGQDFWPFPIPIVKKEGAWFFDTDAGKEELLNRRIGRNELSALEVVRAYAAAQREYASRDRDGDEVLQYAQKFISSEGEKDGLYWPPGLDGETSPLGPLVANAQGEGYMQSGKFSAAPQPYHGYYYKILIRQGSRAPGGRYCYIINGRMIAGFALVAWPAKYGDSGIMTFIVNQQGRVYQKDMGPKTDRLAPAMTQYDPDASWQLSPD